MSALVAAGCARSRFQSVSGGPEDPVRPPRDDEEHRRLGAQDQPGVGHDPVAGHHQMHALGRPYPEPSTATGQALQLIGPDPSGVDHSVREQVGLGARLAVAQPHSGDPVGLPQEPHHLGGVTYDGAVMGRSARDRHRVAGVVGDGVVVPDGADERVTSQRRGDPARAGPGQVLLPGYRARAAHAVVEGQPGRHVRAFPQPPVQRVEEAHRLDQVRSQAVEHQLTFAQRLADQPELQLLEVSQAAVEQLRRA